jgi:hypothetical protein
VDNDTGLEKSTYQDVHSSARSELMEATLNQDSCAQRIHLHCIMKKLYRKSNPARLQLNLIWAVCQHFSIFCLGSCSLHLQCLFVFGHSGIDINHVFIRESSFARSSVLRIGVALLGVAKSWNYEKISSDFFILPTTSRARNYPTNGECWHSTLNSTRSVERLIIFWTDVQQTKSELNRRVEHCHSAPPRSNPSTSDRRLFQTAWTSIWYWLIGNI